jgi:hypothetical protein
MPTDGNPTVSGSNPE